MRLWKLIQKINSFLVILREIRAILKTRFLQKISEFFLHFLLSKGNERLKMRQIPFLIKTLRFSKIIKVTSNARNHALYHRSDEISIPSATVLEVNLRKS